MLKLKYIIIILAIIVGHNTSAQDTIVSKSGKTEAVQIISLVPNSEIIVYKIGNDTIFSRIDNIEKYMLHSELGSLYELSISNDNIEHIENKKFTHQLFLKYPKFDYGKLSLSSNLGAALPLCVTNSRITIEPEYQLNKKLSIKVPIVFGLKKSNRYWYHFKDNKENWPGYHLYSDYNILSWDVNSYNQNPNATMENIPNRAFHEDVIVQFGLSPKFYPWNKSETPLSYYCGFAINIGIMDRLQYSFYRELDTIGKKAVLGDAWWTEWIISETESEVKENSFFFLNYEVMIGTEFNLNKRLNIGLEVLYSFKPIGNGELQDQVFEKRFDGVYELILEGEPNFRREHLRLRGRLFLTYRFGGKKRESI